MFNDITSRYNMTDATLEILIMLLVTFLLGALLGYLLGKRCCKKEASTHSDASERYDDSPAVTRQNTSVQSLAASTTRPDITSAATETVTQVENTVDSAKKTVQDDWKPAVLSAPLGEPDDLKRISGIGPVIEKTLNEFGFFHYQQIAELTKENIAWLDNYIAFPGRIDRENWVGQAKDLLEGNDTEFAKRYDKKD
jgi:NADH-quinone oxidoreductase subunit E